MNLKTQIKIYQKLVSEVGGKFEGAEDFIKRGLKELCSEHGISAEEVRLYITDRHLVDKNSAHKI